MEVSHDREHHWGFFQWFGVGFLIVFGFVTGFSIGLPFLLLGLVLFARLWRRGPAWPADIGLIAGGGAVWLLFAAFGAIGGDVSPTVWAAVGLMLTGAASAGFWWMQCRPSTR